MPPPANEASTGPLRRVRGFLPGATIPAALVAVGTMTANLLGYGFFLVLNRTQSPEELGAIVALTNLAVIGAVPALALQLVVARLIALARHAPGVAGQEPTTTALRTGFLVSLGIAGLTVAASPLVAHVLHLPSVQPALWLVGIVGPTCLTYAVLGVLQGTDRFAALSAVYVLMGVTRLAAGVAAGLAGWGVQGVIMGIAGAACVTALLALFGLGAPGLAGAAHPGPTWTRPVLHGMTATSALLVVSSLDAPLARHYLSAAAAGEFAVLSIFAKASFWAPAFVATAVYSRMATRRGSRHVGLAVSVTAIIVAVGVLVTLVLQRPLLLLVGGRPYEHLSVMAPLFTAIGGMWALAQVFVYWRLARGDHRFGLVLWVVAVGLITTAALAAHDSPAQLGWVLFLGGTAIVTVGSLLLVIAMRRHRTADLLMGGVMPTATDADVDIERDVERGS